MYCGYYVSRKWTSYVRGCDFGCIKMDIDCKHVSVMGI